MSAVQAASVEAMGVHGGIKTKAAPKASRCLVPEANNFRMEAVILGVRVKSSGYGGATEVMNAGLAFAASHTLCA